MEEKLLKITLKKVPLADQSLTREQLKPWVSVN